MAEVKCYFCQEKVDKKIAIHVDKKNFHPACYQTYLDKKDCCDYICGIFGIKAPGPKIYNQLSNFITEKNYSYKNIKRTLQYWYEVKGGRRDKANEGIGIVPFQYDEAMRYYSDLDEKQLQQSKEIEKAIEKEREKEHFTVTTITGKPRQVKQYELY